MAIRALLRGVYFVKFNLHDLNQCPSESVIRSWVRKFEFSGSTLNEKSAGRPRSIRTEENVSEVAVSVRRDPQQSSRKRSAELAISRSSLRRILTKDLKLHPYKLQLVQELKPNDHHLRRAFAETMLERFQSLNNILFSDEAHFHLSGFVNKQNCLYWAEENPQLKHQRPMHSLKVTGGHVGSWNHRTPFLRK
ncbi:uncharacterized protein LOC114241201 [Bombyx mandarina]|uniref:Uncharacterized protein LOC114241201 n=1 Tax=Bombyx mandarina TaxID=7092 RepID=A0A6J2JE71_BOMMA|nr:uncharacterized protein LOC114241201 [Bombyx mandarina]